eukprot:UN05514
MGLSSVSLQNQRIKKVIRNFRLSANFLHKKLYFSCTKIRRETLLCFRNHLNVGPGSTKMLQDTHEGTI